MMTNLIKNKQIVKPIFFSGEKISNNFFFKKQIFIKYNIILKHLYTSNSI